MIYQYILFAFILYAYAPLPTEPTTTRTVPHSSTARYLLSVKERARAFKNDPGADRMLAILLRMVVVMIQEITRVCKTVRIEILVVYRLKRQRDNICKGLVSTLTYFRGIT